MAYIYETHLHTCLGSICGKSRGREYVRHYRDAGFTGVMVTDHFYNGNSSVDHSLSWTDWVREYCRGFEETREAGEKAGLDVFFGWEETFDGDDYLVYGLDSEWLLAHPEAAHWTREEQFREVRKYGGCVIQAHPFRQSSYINGIHLAPFLVDGVEAANAANCQAYDGLALEYARLLGLPVVAGSDMHKAGEYEPFGIRVDKKFASIHDYVRLVLDNKDIGLVIPDKRCVCGDESKTQQLNMKVDIRGKDGRPLASPRYMNFYDIAAYINNTAASGRGYQTPLRMNLPAAERRGIS